MTDKYTSPDWHIDGRDVFIQEWNTLKEMTIEQAEAILNTHASLTEKAERVREAGDELSKKMRNKYWMDTDKPPYIKEVIAIWAVEVAQLETENASLTEKVERLREWCNRVADYVLNWLEGKDDIDFTVHADRLLRDLCNCENELPPCEVCERLALLEGSE